MIDLRNNMVWAALIAAALSATGCKASCDNPGHRSSCDAPAGGACYNIDFEGQWSKPRQGLSLPDGAHFTVLYGAAHSSDYRMWAAGELASGGVEAVAEEGDIGPLQDEVEARIDDDKAGDFVCGRQIDAAGGGATSIVVSSRHRYLSMVSMIAPSSDWFVGVRDLDLFDSTLGDWVAARTVPLFLYDAGTEREDKPFDLDNDAQEPAVPVAERHQQVFFATAEPIATLRFWRVR